MIGTIVNAGAVLTGSAVGMLAGERLPERFKTILLQALGLSTVYLGVQMALSGKKPLLSIGALLVGAVVGELCRIEQRLAGVGEWLQRCSGSTSSSFVPAFVSASLLYVTGAMMIVGSIRDGTAGDPALLYVKSLLDGIAAIALASSLGVGVAFSALSILIAQGAVTLLAGGLLFLQRPEILDAVNGTGGLLILGIGLNLLGVVAIRIGNLMPALFLSIAGAVAF